jgi:hypothetical protein
VLLKNPKIAILFCVCGIVLGIFMWNATWDPFKLPKLEKHLIKEKLIPEDQEGKLTWLEVG